jgi:hypothetical protein
MEEKQNQIEALVERAEVYGKTSIELIKLQAVDKTALAVSIIVSRGILVLILSMFTIIVNIGLAFWLGDLLGKIYYGFFCVAGFYGIAGAILYLFFQSRIRESVSNSIISQLLNPEV